MDEVMAHIHLYPYQPYGLWTNLYQLGDVTVEDPHIALTLPKHFISHDIFLWWLG